MVTGFLLLFLLFSTFLNNPNLCLFSYFNWLQSMTDGFKIRWYLIMNL